ncbi:unnamed protein product [Gordionus sp. m RMFG-2023]
MDQYISTSSKNIDKLLNGGIKFGKITEISGLPGIGKTQMSLQLCINNFLTQDIKYKNVLSSNIALYHESIFVDTEGTFIPQRIKEMIMATPQFALDYKIYIDKLTTLEPSTHIKTQTSSNIDGNSSPVFNKKLTTQVNIIRDEVSKSKSSKEEYCEKIMSQRLHYFRCTDVTQLIALCIHLTFEYLIRHPLVTLIVIDSVAFPLKGHIDKLSHFVRNSHRRKLVDALSYHFRNLVSLNLQHGEQDDSEESNSDSNDDFESSEVSTDRTPELFKHEITSLHPPNKRKLVEEKIIKTYNSIPGSEISFEKNLKYPKANNNIALVLTNHCVLNNYYKNSQEISSSSDNHFKSFWDDIWGDIFHLRLSAYWWDNVRRIKIVDSSYIIRPNFYETIYDIGPSGIIDCDK